MKTTPRILIIEHDPATLDFLGASLTRAGYQTLAAPTGKQGLIEAWRNRPELILLDTDLTDLGGLEIARKLRADPRTAQTKIVIFSARATPDDILLGLQAGADEYVVKRAGADAELLNRIQAQLPIVEAPTEKRKPQGRLISFLSAKGGTGTSSICANMAQALAGLVAPGSVAVVDLVLPIGSLKQIVGIESPNTVIEITLLDKMQITPAKMEQILVAVPDWRFRLLPGARDPQAAQNLQLDRLEAMFQALRQAYDYVLVDFGRALSRVSLPFIRSSVTVVMIVSSDISTAALTKTALHYLEAQGVLRNRIYAVLNRAVGLEGMSRAELEQELALTIAGVIPHMGSAFTLANNLHQPIISKFPTDTAALALRDLTVGLLSRVEELAPRQAG